MLVDFYKWKIVTSNSVCMDRWYVMIFSCFKRTVSIHFDGLFDCSKGYFNRPSLKTVVWSRVVPDTVFKGKIQD